MKKLIESFIFLILIITISNTNVFAKNYSISYERENLATAPPTVTSPIYLCQNSIALPLTAIPSGGTLTWYTTVTGGVALAVAPTPSTATIGSTTYYVTQTIAGLESTPRTPIIVNVVADNGATILGYTCDSSQIFPVSDRASSVFFDWGNNTLIPDNSYNYTYTIQGGASGSGNTTVSHLQVFGMLPGQSATIVLTAATHPCATQTWKCSVPCGASTVNPTFATIPTTYCINDVTPILPTTSTNALPITGSWNPSAINTTTAGTTNYIFTPDPILFPCALSKTVAVTVKPLVIPIFSGIATTVCQNSSVSVLPSISSNSTPISGNWSPSFIDTTILGPTIYTFTPNPGQCASASLTTVTISVVNPPNTLVKIDWAVTDAFTYNQIVTVTAIATGNYLYQLDYGPFQSSNIFENVSSGMHSISVKDVNGCNTPLTVYNVLVINYPKFFTPNGDTYNDIWNIFDLKKLSNFRIFIFDRYGKLLKEISQNDVGWDGTYIGQPMPATDYWFTVEYLEQNTVKKFKSHFSLKR